MEKRFASLAPGNKVSGYAVKWNDKNFIPELNSNEIFKRGSLSVPEHGAPLFVQHSQDGIPIANSKAGTLKFENTPEGLHFEADLPKSAAAVKEAVSRRDLGGASVGFYSIKEARSADGDRIIEKAELQELSLVATPANRGTELNLRNKKPRRRSLSRLIVGV